MALKNVASMALLKKTVSSHKKEEMVEERLFVTSLSHPEQIAAAMGSHWSIESRLHGVLDVRLGDDSCTGRDKNAAKNLNLLRKIAIDILKTQPYESMS